MLASEAKTSSSYGNTCVIPFNPVRGSSFYLFNCKHHKKKEEPLTGLNLPYRDSRSCGCLRFAREPCYGLQNETLRIIPITIQSMFAYPKLALLYQSPLKPSRRHKQSLG